MSAGVDMTGSPHAGWLTAERVRLYACGMLLWQVVVIAQYLYHGLAGNDFRVFWAASRLVLDGHGVDAYDIAQLFPLQQSVTPGLAAPNAWQYWFYPPPFLLAVTPLALLPYAVSFLLFDAAGLCLFLCVLRLIVPLRGGTFLALSAPAVSFILVNGQNTFLTAGLAGLALVLLDRRPRLAGMLVGLLVCKPQLALLFGVAFCAGGRWQALRWAAVTALALLAASLLVFSPRAALAFLEQVQAAKSFADHGQLPLAKMPTVYAGARLLGLGIDAANWLHGAVALAAAGTVAWLWAGPAPAYLRNAALVLGCLLVSPHLFDYDLLWLAWPVGWLSVHALRHGWQTGERALLVLAWSAPLIGDSLAWYTGFQLTPPVIVVLLAMLVRRELARRQALSGSSLGRGRNSTFDAHMSPRKQKAQP